jgi:large subunit ribosomal protein L24
MHIKKGDNVVVLSGNEKGKKGKIARVMPKKGLAVVEGLNLRKKHQKARSDGKKGQMVDVAMPMNVSKLAKSN